MNTAYLALGSNLGDRQKNMTAALDHLTENGIHIQQCSTIVETEPVGGPPQGKFLNAVAKATTQLNAHQLLQKIKLIERKMGRTKTVQNGPRIIDIDILLYNDENIKSGSLVIPHPRMRERSFVMEPLKEIDPELYQTLVHANY